MQSTLRSRLAAAALLLAPVAALVAAQPVAAQDWQRNRFADQRQQRDNRGPDISEMKPGNGESVRVQPWTHVSARIGDDRSGIDTKSVVVRIDGRDVTGESRIYEDSVNYTEAIYPGRHVMDVVVRDLAGNVSRRSWTFNVVDADGRIGQGGGREGGRHW